MFFYRIMPILDLIAAFLLVFGASVPVGFLRFFSMYLVGKGAFFAVAGKDVPSAIDFLIGVYGILIVYFGWYNSLLSIICFAFLAQKSFFGLAH